MSLRRILFWAVPLALLALGLGAAFMPRPVETDLVAASRGPMVATLAEKGRTRIRDIFTVSAPVGGETRRIDIEPGDPVVAGETLLAEIEPADPAFLDRRSEAEARAAVEAARAALALARSQLSEAEAERDFAEAEFNRARSLRASNTISARAMENAERIFRARQAAVATAEAAVRMRVSELQAARTRLLRPTEETPDGCPCVPIHAPVSGQVLRVLQESATVVAAGTPLLEIGDPHDLEIEAEYLSADAVRIAPGQRVIVDRWGGGRPLNGEVVRVEPFGFTKVSALGIEEQRVTVVIALTDPPRDWARLGHGFEVEVRVVLWESDDALKLPLTALFRDGDGWAVFAVEDGRAVLTPVGVGHRTDLEAEITSGLAPGAEVVRYPSDAIEAGSRVAQP